MLDKEFRIKPFAWIRQSWAAPVLVIAAFFIWFALFYLPWSTLKINWPSWVQAVGSIGAILVAILVANRQWQQQLLAKADSDAEKLRKIVAIARYVGKVSGHASIYISLGDPVRRELCVFASKIRQSGSLLDSVSYMDVPLAEAALGWIEVRHAVVELNDWFDFCLSHGGVDTTDEDGFSASNLRLQRAVVRVLNAARHLLPDMPLDDGAVG